MWFLAFLQELGCVKVYRWRWSGKERSFQFCLWLWVCFLTTLFLIILAREPKSTLWLFDSWWRKGKPGISGSGIVQKALCIRCRLRDRRWFPALTFCVSALLPSLRLLLLTTPYLSSPSLGLLLPGETSLSHGFLPLTLVLSLQPGPPVLTFNQIPLTPCIPLFLWSLPCPWHPCLWYVDSSSWSDDFLLWSLMVACADFCCGIWSSVVPS